MTQPQLSQSPAFIAVDRLMPGNERLALKISSCLCVLLKIAWMDRELCNIEQQYLMRESAKWCDLDEDKRKLLLDMISTLVRRNLQFPAFEPLHLQQLQKTLTPVEKVELLEAASIISRCDLEVAPSEEFLLMKVGKELGLPARDVTGMIMNAKYIAGTRLQEAKVQCQEKRLDPEASYELPVIQLDF